MESSAGGNCRGSTAGIPAYQWASMATAVPLITVVGPPTGTCRVKWFEYSQWTLVRIAEGFLLYSIHRPRQNCLGAIRWPPITVFVTRDQEKLVTVTFSGPTGRSILIS